MAVAPTHLWYFAYGSNLDPRTFLGRRGMRPRATLRARLDGYALRFDLPVGPGERAVGNVQPAPDRVEGVAYELGPSDAARLDRSEGIPGGAYRREPVHLTLEDGSTLAAFTYHAPRGVAGRKPSRRYLGLLLRGARHHLMSAEWIAYLRSLPVAVDERESAQLTLL